MGKQRLTFVTDGDSRITPGMAAYIGGVGRVTVESVEDVPEPPTVQEFRVRCVTRPSAVRAYRSTVENILNEVYGGPHAWSVTEVAP